MARLLAFFAIVLWGILLSPYPSSVFIASVTAALTLPVYRGLRARMHKTTAITCFSLGLVCCLATPITIVTVMIVPQPQTCHCEAQSQEVFTSVLGVTRWVVLAWDRPSEQNTSPETLVDINI